MSCKLFVGSLAWGVTTEILRRAFEPCGQITDAIVMMSREDPTKSRGYGFVTFSDPETAKRACEQMDGFDLEGRRIRVDLASGRGGGGGGPGGADRGGNRAQGRPYGDSRAPSYGDNRSSSYGSGYQGQADSRQSSGYGGSSNYGGGRDRGPGGYHQPPSMPANNEPGYGEFPSRGGRYDAGPPRDRGYESRSRDYSRGGSDDRDRRGRNDSYRGESGYSSNSSRRVVGGGGEAMKDPQSENNRVYITGITADTTEDDLAGLFGSIGKVARRRQKHGYPDQWPWKVSIYCDDAGKPKGDATLTYEDPNAAQTAPEFFNGAELKGSKITVELAKVKDPVPSFGGRGRGRGGFRGGRRGGGRRY